MLQQRVELLLKATHCASRGDLIGNINPGAAVALKFPLIVVDRDSARLDVPQ